MKYSEAKAKMQRSKSLYFYPQKNTEILPFAELNRKIITRQIHDINKLKPDMYPPQTEVELKALGLVKIGAIERLDAFLKFYPKAIFSRDFVRGLWLIL